MEYDPLRCVKRDPAATPIAKTVFSGSTPTSRRTLDKSTTNSQIQDFSLTDETKTYDDAWNEIYD